MSFIVLSGNIGAGKSYSMKMLQQQFNLPMIKEPVKQWEDLGIIDEYYKDRKKFTYEFQTTIFATRCLAIANDTSKECFIERSPDEDKIFMRVNYKDEMCTKMQYDQYLIWCNAWERIIDKKIGCIIYIRTNPTICLERIKKRGNKYEKDIKISYLEDLHNEYDLYIATMAAKGIKVYTINADNENFSDDLIKCVKNHLENKK